MIILDSWTCWGGRQDARTKWLNAILKKTDLEQEQEAKEEQNRLCWEKLNKEIEEKFKKTHAQSQG